MSPQDNKQEIVKLDSIIVSKDIGNIGRDLAEISIDGVLKEGLLKDIPIVNTAVNLYNFGNTINKNIFIKKICQFLFQLQDTSEKEREDFILKLNKSSKFRHNVGENLFELLERISSEGKPEIIGKLFSATIKGEIGYRDFLKLSYIIEKQFYYDLLDLKDHAKNGKVIGLQINDSLFASELVSPDFLPAYKGNQPEEPTTLLTEYGKILVRIGMAD